MEILMLRGFTVFRFCLKICAHSQLIEYWDHFLFLLLFKDTELDPPLYFFDPLYWCSPEIKRVTVGFGELYSAPCTWSGHCFALQCQNCSELQLYFIPPWCQGTGMHSATKNKWYQPGKEAAGACCPPSQPLKKEVQWWTSATPVGRSRRACGARWAADCRAQVFRERFPSSNAAWPLCLGKGLRLTPAPAGMRCPISLSQVVRSHRRAGSYASVVNYLAEPVTKYMIKKYILPPVRMGNSQHWLSVNKEQFTKKWGRRTV